MQLSDRRLYLLFTPALCSGDPWRTLDAALGAGVDLVQWRSPTGDHNGFDRCLERCREAGVPLIVNDDVAFAVAREADGAHVGQTDLPIAEARRLLGDRLLGASTHDPIQIERAVLAGADHLGFGPCFPTGTKGYLRGQPDEAVRSAVTAAAARGVPLFAIGGIAPDNLGRLLRLGVERVAVCGAVLGSEDPAATVTTLRAALGLT